MNFSRPIILASSSPRRKQLMRELGFDFQVQSPDIDESFPNTMPLADVPGFLAQQKARVFLPHLTNEIVVAADTVVILKNTILNKPANRQEAMAMLTQLSGQTHTVVTAVCLLSKEKEDCFSDHTQVTFQSLTTAEIEYYVDTFQPFDKAGAYGAQDWIGLVAVKEIVGSYFTVMGLPTHLVYARLMRF